MMDAKRIAELRAACNAAAPAPWRHVAWRHMQHDVFTGDDDCAFPAEGASSVHCWHRADAEFIALARTALPELLDEVERLRGAVLRPLSPHEIEAALHEGRAEAMAATGDNAWTSLLKQRDEARAQLARVEAERDELQEKVIQLQAASDPRCVNCACEIRNPTCHECTECDAILTERDEEIVRLKAEVAKMRAVVEAAKAWHVTMTEPNDDRECNAPSLEQVEAQDAAVHGLMHAIDALTATTRGDK